MNQIGIARALNFWGGIKGCGRGVFGVAEAAETLGVSRKTLASLLNGKSRVTPAMAPRLSTVFGRTPEGWLKLKLQYDPWQTRSKLDISHLKRIEAA